MANLNLKAFLLLTFIFGIPLSSSLLIFHTYDEEGRDIEIVAIHPNLDCRTEKYILPQDSVIHSYLALTKELITRNTDYVLWPETAIPNAGWIHELSGNSFIDKIKGSLSKFDNSKLVTGAIVYEVYNENLHKGMLSLTKFQEQSKVRYLTYNGVIQIGMGNSELFFRSKKQLVPIEETIPFKGKVSFLRDFFPSLGGFLFSSRFRDTELFPSRENNKILPIICYETAFGALTSEKVRDGADMIFVILNEGWYKNISGASHLMNMSCIRAIENRRAVARSSNDGITCFINQRGEVVNMVSEFIPKAIKSTLKSNKNVTMYTLFGDFIGKSGVIILGGLSIYFLLFKRSK